MKPSCTKNGSIRYYECTGCGKKYSDKSGKKELTGSVAVSAAGHSWGAWKVTGKATVFAAARQTRICKVCKEKQTRTKGKKLKPTIKLSASSLKLQVKQKTKKFRVSGMANGDSVKKWKSSNKKVVKVSGKANDTCTITATGRVGTAKITVTLAGGLKRTVRVVVQKKRIATSKVKFSASSVKLKKGKKITLQVLVTPVSSQDTLMFSSSNKKVATVSKKGVVTAKKKGKTKITVISGKKKAVCTITVVK